MATNAEPDGADDTENLSDEEELRRAKYENKDVETSDNEEDETDDSDLQDDETSDDEGEDDGQTDDDANEDESEETDETESDEDDSGFVKEFDNIKGDTLEDYARNLEAAYRNSTSEALRLKGELDKALKNDTSIGDTGDDDQGDDSKQLDITDPTKLYMKQKMDEEISEAFTEFESHYPQVHDVAEYDKFTRTVGTLSSTILSSEKRLAAPRELYSKAAVILGWEPTETKPTKKEKLGIAIKGRVAISKGSGGPKKLGKASKVSQKMIEANRKMYPGKTDAEIRDELEPYVQ